MRTHLALLLFVQFLLGISLRSQSTQFYSTTSHGGTNVAGTIFRYIAGTSTVVVVHNFTGSDGSAPTGSLEQATDNNLYGMAASLGGHGKGVIYKYDPVNNLFGVILNFNDTLGATPYCGLTQATDGKLYGLTFAGGTSHQGVLFSLDPVTSNYTVLKNFNGTSDGMNPKSTLAQGTDGKLYGTTQNGGTHGAGVLFAYDPGSGAYNVLHNFDTLTGRNPEGNKLLLASDGLFYGVAEYGGASDMGVLYSFNPTGSVYTVRFTFTGYNGERPIGSLYQHSDGKIYGSTYAGGFTTYGAYFSYDPALNVYQQINNYAGPFSSSPMGGFAVGNTGLLYGASYGGGSTGYGPVFSLDPVNGVVADMFDFGGLTNPSFPSYQTFVAFSPAGILNKTASIREVNIYPVPSRDGNFTLHLTGTGFKGLEIYNALGQMVLSRQLDSNLQDTQTRVDLGAGSAGLYFVRVETAEGVIRKKILVGN